MSEYSNFISEKGNTIRVLDTDMGVDDTMAVILTGFMGQNRPDYVIVSPGNTSVDNGVRNLLAVRRLFGLDFKVVRGRDEKQPETGKETFHGADGFANMGDSFIRRLGMTGEDLEDYIDINTFSTILAGAGSIEYTAIGPLVNLAGFLKDDSIKDRIGKMYIMGGGIHKFNCLHNTEFNFFKSPAAVKTVLSSGKDIVLFPLDVTNQMQMSMDMIHELAASRLFPEAGPLLEYNYNSNVKFNGIYAAVPHDTAPIMYQFVPGDFETADMLIDSDEYGATVESPDGNKITVALNVTPGLFMEKLREALL